MWLIFRIIMMEMTGAPGTGAAVFLWSGVAFWLLKRNCLITDESKATEELGVAEENKEADMGGRFSLSNENATPVYLKGDGPMSDTYLAPNEASEEHNKVKKSKTPNEASEQHNKVKKSKRNKILLLVAGIVIVLIIIVTSLITPQYKYNYVLENQNSYNLTTLEYLKDLKKRDYKDSADIYMDLYGWKVTVYAINSSESDETTHKKSISKYSPVYFHFKLTGGEPDAKMRITVKSTLPNGKVEEYTVDDKWESGESGWYGWYDGIYEYPQYSSTGTLQCKFYDEEGNMIGSASVRITDSDSLGADEGNQSGNITDTPATQPTCIKLTCDNIVTVVGTYCSEHKCANSTCSFEKDYNSQYCSVCQCMEIGCKNLQIVSGYYCKEHTCKATGCTSGKQYSSDYCITHKCVSCGNQKINNGHYCKEHTCIVSGCTNQKLIGDYCYNHTN